MKQNVILTDFQTSEKWDFKNAVEEQTGEPWSVETRVTNRYHGSKIKSVFRYVNYFTFAFKIFLRRKKYAKIIAWQQFFGLIVAFYCALFHANCALDIYVMTFIYKPKNKVYNKFINYIVHSGYIKKLIVLSDSEKSYYSDLFGINSDIFYCTRIGVSDLSDTIVKNKQSEKFYLSVGRSNRDYVFLKNAWDVKYGKLVIISDSYNLPAKNGITCLNNCYGRDFLQYLADCYALIIPLDDVNISSGSLSFLQAMMLSKPTIVTDNVTVHDYIQSGYNGFIIQKSGSDLYTAINKLNNEETYSFISKNARREFVDKFSERSLGENIGTMIYKHSLQ